MKTLGFIGVPTVTQVEHDLLVVFGRIAGRSGRVIHLSPTSESAHAVEVGVKAEEGTVLHLVENILTSSAHSFVYADEPLLMKIRAKYPNFGEMRNVHLFSSPLEISLYITEMKRIFRKRAIPFPE